MVTALKFLACIRCRNRGLAAALIALLMFAIGPSARAEQPKTIPTFKQWTEAAGSYSFSSNSEIVLDAAYSSQLANVASTFAQDLQDLTGYSIPIVVGLGSSKPGDIYLTLDAADSAIGQEGYLLGVADQIGISAQTTTGVFYGTRSVLQMLRQGLEIQAGTALDWPDYPKRGLMVDLGRKYFSVPFLERHIKELAYLKLNYFHFHLSDDLGFRLESTSHPEITSPLHYTKADIQALLALAQSYHVMIVPEIDLPAHAVALLASHPELQLPGNPDKLDLGQPASYTLVKDLLDEYLPLFPAPFWHTGGDEYLALSDYANYPELLSYARQLYGPNASAQDSYIGFVNWVDGIVRAQGKQMRAWNDVYGTTGNANAPNPDIALDMWTTSILASDALAKGHTILNCNYATLYFVLGRASSDQADPVNLYENWAPNLQWPGNVNLPAQAPGILGGKFHVWCDSPEAQTEDEVQTNLVSYLRSLAQNTWGSSKLVPTFNAFSQIVDQIGHFPAWGPDFTLTSSSLNASVTPGQTATYSLRLTPLMGFNRTIIIGCTVNAPGAACGLSSGIVTLDGSAASEVTVSVSTIASSLGTLNRPARPGPGLPFQHAWVALIVPGLFWRRRTCSVWRKGRIPVLFLVTLLSWCLASAGCGSAGSTDKIPQISTPAGPYTVTVQAASGSIVHQTVLNLTVQ